MIFKALAVATLALTAPAVAYQAKPISPAFVKHLQPAKLAVHASGTVHAASGYTWCKAGTRILDYSLSGAPDTGLDNSTFHNMYYPDSGYRYHECYSYNGDGLWYFIVGGYGTFLTDASTNVEAYATAPGPHEGVILSCSQPGVTLIKFNVPRQYVIADTFGTYIYNTSAASGFGIVWDAGGHEC